MLIKCLNTVLYRVFQGWLSSATLYIFYIDSSIFVKILEFDTIFWFNMFVITILSTTFATSIYFFGAAKYGAKEVSSFVFLVPASAIIIGNIFLDEKIEFTTIIGVILAMIAIYILNNLSFFRLFRKKS